MSKFKPVSSQVDFPKLEKQLLEKWYKNGIVEKYLRKNDDAKEKFSFLDGPITANNPMGVHHAWGRTYKDFFQRYWNMRGYKQRFQNGFDEQGLWVEVEVEKELGLRNKKDIENLVPGDRFKSLEKFINLCKDRVKKYSQIQTEQSKRLGYFMDWENSYHTSSDENNYAIWNFIKVVSEKGWLYKGHDSVPWCPRCGTAISQHEILTEEYKELTHDTVYFKLPIRGRENEFLLVWTTTPWTIPANVAVAVNPKEKYLGYDTGNELLWVMEKRLSELLEKNILKPQSSKGEKSKINLGSELIGWEYDGPFDDLPLVKKTLEGYTHRVIDGGEVVTETEGTGLLHVAPGAGQEDFKLGKENKLPVLALIEEDASYVVGLDEFSGKNAKKHPELIIDFLKEKDNGMFLFAVQKYTHRYPTCWRCKTELVWRVVDEWYIAMDKADKSGKTYREQMIETAKTIHWLPEWGFDRELDWLNNMHDWLISKKRYWGLALPIWECQDCGTIIVIGSKEELQKKAVQGYDKFQSHSPHRPWVDEVKIKCNCGKIISRIPDVGNPWLDAGIVPFSTMSNEWFPADFITESFPGQFKNWFYSLIAMSTALTGGKSFHTVLGFASVRDEKGEEMHKSKGNSIEFNQAADSIGVDVMRWLYLRTNPEHNVNFGFHIADEMKRLFFLRLWNVYSFFTMYAAIDSWMPKEKKSEHILDRWILSRLNSAHKIVSESIEKYDAYTATITLERFIIDELSNWYIRRIRDRVGPSAQNIDDKDKAYSTTYTVLMELTKIIAPFIPFVADEMFVNLTAEESVHLKSFPKVEEKFLDPTLEEKMELGIKLSSVVHAFRKTAGIKVRVPFKELFYEGPKELDNEILKVVLEEVNVQKLTFKGEKNEFTISGDTSEDNLDKMMGYARDIIRKIQEERKKLGTKLDDRVDVILEDYPKEYEEFIKSQALVDQLSIGETFSVTKK